MTIGEQKLSTMLPYLNEIAVEFSLKLNRAKEFKIARAILAIRYKTI